MKVKTSTVTRAALDWAVALAEGHKPPLLRVLRGNVALPDPEDPMSCEYLDYSTCYELGGPIIDREGIATRQSKGVWYAMMSADLGDGERAQWAEFTFRGVAATASTSRRARFVGSTQLIAAMLCWANWKLGEEIDIPEELL
jgi:hypothetical protein